MNIKRFLTVVLMMAVVVTFAATPEIRNVTAKQRFPWNGLVDITCQVTGMDSTTKPFEFTVAVVNHGSGDVKKASHFWVVRDGMNLNDKELRTNGSYRLLWDAGADLDAGLYSNMVVQVNCVAGHEKVQLWEGGPYWATTNIGAEEPWESGYCFWWGDTVGYKRENNAWEASDGSSSNFSFDTSNAPTYENGISTLRSQGWITSDNVLAPVHDAAHMQWGGNWRMPTLQEWEDLNNNCDWTWTELNGVNGYVVRGKGVYASNGIFLPVAGVGVGTSLSSVGSLCNYWSSVPFLEGGRSSLSSLCISIGITY